MRMPLTCGRGEWSMLEEGTWGTRNRGGTRKAFSWYREGAGVPLEEEILAQEQHQ